MNNLPQDEPRFSRAAAVQLAHISLELLERCEAEQLIEVQILPGSELVYSVHDIRQLALIQRLCEVLEINYQDVEVVLHLRKQVLDLQKQIEELEQQRIDREEQLLLEVVDLRQRLAEQAEWTG